LRIHSTYDICITQAAPPNTQGILHKKVRWYGVVYFRMSAIGDTLGTGAYGAGS